MKDFVIIVISVNIKQKKQEPLRDNKHKAWESL